MPATSQTAKKEGTEVQSLGQLGLTGISLITLIVLFFVWWFLTAGIKIVKPLYFPSPHSFLETFLQMLQRIWILALLTLFRVVVSWSIASFFVIVIVLL